MFESALQTGYESERIDIVFYVYRDISIKTAERAKRVSDEGFQFNKIMPGHRIKCWSRLLTSSSTKTKLITYLSDDWKNPEKREKPGAKLVYVTCGEKCFRLSKDSVEEVDELNTTQEEADTRMLLHAKQAAADYTSVIIVADDTDVLILCMAFNQQISCNLYVRRGTKTRLRVVDVGKLATAIGLRNCNALIGMHAYTGCDTISSFAGHGKLTALKLLLRNAKFQEAFADLGQ